MALVLNDRVRETTSVVGTGAVTLLGAVTGFQSFSTIGNANTTYYCISDQAGVNWEVGIGTYTSAGTTLARTTVLASSNAGSLVSFTAGTKDVFVTYPAETSVSGGGGGTYPTIQPSLNLDFANTKLLDPRITFVRNSTAAYYDGQTTAMAEQNLLLYSQLFATAPWTIQAGSSVTINTVTAPDGTTTGSTFNEGTGVSYHDVEQVGLSLPVGAFTFSTYLKYVAQQYAIIAISGATSGTYVAGSFDLVGGTVSSSANSGSVTTLTGATITSVGNGWYRCTISGTVITAGSFTARIATSPTGTIGAFGIGTYTGTSQLIYIWGAQLEQRSSVTAYTPTTTAAITNYIPVLMTAPAGVARFDCDPITGKSLGLLIEESRVNLLTYSSDFSNVAWGKTNSTSTSAATIAPDGTQTANLFIDNTTNGGHIASQSTTTTVQSYTASIYIKTYQLSKIMIYNYVNGQGIGFDASTGATFTVTGITPPASSSYSITSISNGWYRCTLTYTGAISSALSFGYYLISGTTFSYAGTGQGIYVWGAQLEAGSFATSLIPTVASTVTRAADDASMTGTNFSSWYNQAQGSLYCEYDFIGVSSVNGVATPVSLSDNTANNRIRFNVTSATSVSYDGAVAGVLQWSINITTTSSPKLAGSYTTNNINAASNGILGTSDTLATIPLITQMQIGNLVTGRELTGHIRKLSYYPVALSSSNLVALTS